MTTAPTINLNGSHGPALLEDVMNAHDAVGAAIAAAQKTSPNGRDYQTAPKGAFEAARAEHICRLTRLNDIVQEFEALAIAIQGQIR